MNKQHHVSFLEMFFLLFFLFAIIIGVVYVLSGVKNSTNLTHSDFSANDFIINTDDVFPKEICKNNIKYTVSRHASQKTSLDNYMVMRYGSLFSKDSYYYSLSEPQGTCTK